MLSLLSPSSNLCLHQQPNDLDLDLVPSPSIVASLAPTPALPSSTMPSSPSTIHPIPRLAPFKHQPSSSSPSSINYKDFVAHFTTNSPQPYGIIPRRKRSPTTRPRSSSTSSLSAKKGSSSSPSPSSSSRPKPSSARTSLELLPTLPKSEPNTDNNRCEVAERNNLVHAQFIQPFFHSLQAFLPESSSSSTRLGFWANLKAQYLASTASWSSSSASSTASEDGSAHKVFSPPIALRLSNGTPIASVDATPRSASLSLSDALLALPNLASPSSHSYHGSATYPVSVAAMDRLKPRRSDTIPLKTFTYLETPVVERPRPVSVPILPSRSPRSTCQSSSSSPNKGLSKQVDTSERETQTKTTLSLLPPPLPRCLLSRETRSNSDYLRTMACELRMIRSRKLISPLKPRGYLPRRKDPFRNVKSTLCISIEVQSDEHDHPLNDVLVGSFSSVSSTDSYLSSTSSTGYQTANESFY